MADLPRLLLCCFDVIPAPTAISRRITEYLKGLSERYQVVALTVKTPDHTHIERYHGARLLRVPVGSGDLAARVQAFDRAVRRQLDSEEYVMVHFFDPFGGYAPCERRSEFGYKLVYDACSLPSVDLPFLVSPEEANRRFIAKVRRQELFCLMNADVVIVANELTRDFVAGLGVTREQVQVLPAPVDLAPYDPAVMGVPDATPMKLLHLGNQSAAQDLSTLLEAMQLALQTVDVRLTILGPKDAEHQARLEEQVAALKLSGKVDFQPQVAHDDLHKVLAAADVGLLTLSDVERNSRVGSPLSRLGEYLAAGRPVIAADVAAARALLPDDGVVLYRPQDKHSLADAIVSLATEPNRRVKLGAAARAASLERDAAKVRADLVAIYVTLSGTGVRAVGDADTTTPDEVTQLGVSIDGEDTQKKKKKKARNAGEPPSGTNKVKTDPAMVAEDTSPEAAPGDHPSVMGVPIREEEPPVVLGQQLQEVAAEFAQVSTEPNAKRQTEPPVVMGMPLSEPSSSPTAYTPGDLAAELGDIPSSGTPATEAPTTDIPDEPRHLDDAPRTGSHLSLVPVAQDVDEPLATAPQPLPPVTAPDAPPVRSPPLSREFIPELELPAFSSSPSMSRALTPPETPAFAAPEAPAFIPPLELPSEASMARTITPPETPAFAAPEAPGFIPPLELPSVTSAPSTSRAAISARAEPTPVSPSEVEGPFASANSESAREPSTSLGQNGGSTPVSPSEVEGFFASVNSESARKPSTPLGQNGGSILVSSSPSGLTSPPPLPKTPTPVPTGGVPLLTVPPMPTRSAAHAPKSGSSGAFATFTPSPPAMPPPRSSPSGTFATFTPAPSVPPPRSSPSAGFAPSSASVPLPRSSPSGTFVPFVPKSSPSGSFSTLTPTTAPNPPPKSNTSGIFATLTAAAHPPRPKDRSGLFPEPPSVPGPEEINDGDIEEVLEGDGPVEVGADEIVDVPEAEAAPAVEEVAMMASEESVTTVDTEAGPPASAIDPWLAQLVHGYCPPESGLFLRHVPPTTMPGRDT